MGLMKAVEKFNYKRGTDSLPTPLGGYASTYHAPLPIRQDRQIPVYINRNDVAF